ncbi:MAG: DUF3576 domain-containing protein [Parvularcula sp.]|jgi:hypothetical protein|nr:DUF3576 domain-containing protein [Parvularcula sp.]
MLRVEAIKQSARAAESLFSNAIVSQCCIHATICLREGFETRPQRCYLAPMNLISVLRPETRRLLKIFGTAAMAAALAACANTGKTRSLSFGSDTASIATNVNRYLWTASLETIDFMPLESADPTAGVIITDWHASEAVPTERFRTNVLILDSSLRADALRVRVFRQVQEAETGEWVDAPINPNTAREVENAILTRARELKLNSTS